MNDECDPAELLTRRGLLKALNAALLALGTAEAVMPDGVKLAARI